MPTYDFFSPDTMFFGITVYAWLTAIGSFAAIVLSAILARHILTVYITKMAQKTKGSLDDIFVEILESVRPTLYYSIAFFMAVRLIDAPYGLRTISAIFCAFALTHAAVRVIDILSVHITQRYVSVRDDEEESTVRSAISLMTSITKLLVWVGSGLFVISNFGVDITSLIAGLGIGGIAVALALQNILKDLFSSFSIFFDKPFAIGDFIEIGDKSGTVQKIGIKTTRLKALSGEELIISNQDLTSAQVRNFKRMQERRVSQKIGIVYETPQEKVAQLPHLIEEVINAIDDVRFSRAHFYSFDDWALTFEIVYFVKSRDYKKYMDVRQAINLGIMRMCADNGIDMAYPTQVVYHKEKK